jgi:Fe-S-cluster containining protein
MSDYRTRSSEAMNREPSIFFLGCGPDKPALQGGTEALPLPLRMGTESMIFWVGFRSGTADLSEIVPVARKLSDLTIDATLKTISDRGGTVACHKGCHAGCCRHLLVSLSVPEALAMVGEVNAQDSETRTRTIQSCQAVADKIRERLAANPALAGRLQGRDGILNWYMGLDAECPFLADNCCSIYDRRPITCRECLVTTPDSYCRKSVGQIVQKVKLPVRFANVLTQLSKELYGTEDEMVVLPCVFDWYVGNSERYGKTWPTEYLVRRFIEITVSKSTLAPFTIGLVPSSMDRSGDREIKTVR